MNHEHPIGRSATQRTKLSTRRELRGRNGVRLITTLLALLAVPLRTAGGAQAHSSAPAQSPLGESLDTATAHQSSTPFSFIENRGQWPPPTLFVARLANLFVGAERDGIVLQPRGGGVTIRLGFEHATEVQVEGEGPTLGRYHFYFGNDPMQWRTDVRSFRSLHYRCLEDQVEFVLHEREGRLKYDMLVPAGADVDKVVIRCDGADHLSVDATGSLCIATSVGQIVQFAAPSFEVLQSGERRTIEAHYTVLADDRFCIDVPTRDPKLPLVIDPDLIWSTYLGGMGSFDAITGVAIDAQRNTFLTGSTDWPGFPTTPGSFDTSGNNVTSIFVTKIDPSGSELVYSALLGGLIESNARAITIDTLGQATVAGRTNSFTFPTTSGAFDTVKTSQGYVGIVFRLSESGSALVFSTYLEGTGSGVEPNAIAVASSGATIVGGFTADADFPTTQGAFDTTYAVGDGFVTRLEPQGRFLEWSTFLGGSNPDKIRALALDADENVTVTGETASTDFPTTPNSYMPLHPSGFPSEPYNGFVTRIDSTGTALVWSTYLGSYHSDDYPLALAVGREGEVVVGGHTLYGWDFPTTPGAFQARGFAPNGFVSRFDPTGSTLIYSTLLVASGSAKVRGLAVDPSGIVTITGETGAALRVTPGAFDTHWESDFEGYVARLNPSGSRFYYATFLGGNGLDTLQCLALHPDRRVTVAGSTSGAYPTTQGAFSPGPFGGQLDGVATTIDLDLEGVRWLGAGTPSCLGMVDLNATMMPAADSTRFGLYVSAAPVSSHGWMFIGRPRSSPVIIRGAQLWIDLAQPFTRVPIASDAHGFVEIGLPLTGLGPGTSFGVQALLRNGEHCAGSTTLCSSRAVSIIVQ